MSLERTLSGFNRVAKRVAIGTVAGITLFTSALTKPLNAESAPKWEITAGYVNRQVGEVKFTGRSDFQTQQLDKFLGELSQDPSYVGGIEESHFIDGMGNNAWLRRYYEVTLGGVDQRARIIDTAMGSEPDGITNGHVGGEVYDSTIKFRADEATISGEAFNTNSGERSANLGNSSGYMLGVRRNFNDILSLALEFAGGFKFSGETSTSPSGAVARYKLDEITDTYQLISGDSVNMNEYQRERQTKEEGDLISIRSYVNERAKVDLNTLSLVGRVGKTLKRLRLEGLVGPELNFVRMTVDRNESSVVSSGIPEMQECINNSELSQLNYQNSTSESKSKVIPGMVVGGGVAYRLVQGKKVDVDVGVEGRYHLPFDKMQVGNAEADLKGYSVMAKATIRF